MSLQEQVYKVVKLGDVLIDLPVSYAHLILDYDPLAVIRNGDVYAIQEQE